jgi:hypothetical protein
MQLVHEVKLESTQVRHLPIHLRQVPLFKIRLSMQVVQTVALEHFMQPYGQGRQL